MMNSFWWGRNQKERKGINWASWDRLCLLKNEGGLAFRKLHLHNVSLVANKRGDYYQNPIHLWRAFMGQNTSLIVG